jgi:VCBS repeat-containing protein
MRSALLPLALALSVAVGGVALAETATGVVKSYDSKTHMVTLEDGTMYKVQKSAHVKGLKAGEKVTVTFKMKGKDMEASKIVASK